MTQKALGDALGLEYYNFISQIELGYAAVPASLWVPLANTLNLDRFDFMLTCLSGTYPDVYSALFGNKSRMEVKKALTKLFKGEHEV